MKHGSNRVDKADPRLESGEAWDGLCRALDAARDFVLGADVPASARDRAEGFRYLTRLLAAGTAVCMEHADPEQPLFGRMMDHTIKWGLDAPDCLYLYASVRSGETYRIFGNRGTANHLDIQVNQGHFCEGDINAWGTLASLSSEELVTDADGSFELFLGAGCGARNELPLGQQAEFVLVRQYFNDWERELPAELDIERVGPSAAAVGLRSDDIADRLERLTRWISRGGALWERMSRGFLALEPNSIVMHAAEASSARAGMKGQVYGLGNFHCHEREAVLVEFVPPACRHLSVGLANWYWESLDYATRQTSLNGYQARVDADGVLRIVISHLDPQVPNWLDTMGNERGTLALRFLSAADIPRVTLRRVSVAGLRAELPDDTPYVTHERRAETLVARRRAVARRFRR